MLLVASFRSYSPDVDRCRRRGACARRAGGRHHRQRAVAAEAAGARLLRAGRRPASSRSARWSRRCAWRRRWSSASGIVWPKRLRRRGARGATARPSARPLKAIAHASDARAPHRARHSSTSSAWAAPRSISTASRSAAGSRTCRSFAKYLGGSPANTAVGAVAPGPARGDAHARRRRAQRPLRARDARARRRRRVAGAHRPAAPDRAGVPRASATARPSRCCSIASNCADMALDAERHRPGVHRVGGALLVSGTHLSQPQTFEACMKAMRAARAAGTRVVLDIDYRPVLWGLTVAGLGEQRFVASERVSEHLQRVLPLCDLVVGTEEEIHIAGGSDDTRRALRRIRTSAPQALVVMKRGPMGCVAYGASRRARRRPRRPGLPGRGVQRARRGRRLHGRPAARLGARRAAAGLRCATPTPAARSSCRATAARRRCRAATSSSTSCSTARRRAACARTRARAPAPRDDAHATLAGARGARLRPPRCSSRSSPPAQATAPTPRAHRALQAAGRAGRRAGYERRAQRRPNATLRAACSSTTATAPTCCPRSTGQRLVDRPPGGAARLAPAGVRARRQRRPDAAQLAGRACREVPRRATTPTTTPRCARSSCSTLAVLAQACIATGHELLLEVIPPRELRIDGDTLPRAVDADLRAPASGPTGGSCRRRPTRRPGSGSADVIGRHDPHCRGVLLLGLEASEDDLALGFASPPRSRCARASRSAARSSPTPRRPGSPASSTTTASIAQVAVRYRRLIASGAARAPRRKPIPSAQLEPPHEHAHRIHRPRHDGPRHGEEPARQGLRARFKAHRNRANLRGPARRRRGRGRHAAPNWRRVPTS